MQKRAVKRENKALNTKKCPLRVVFEHILCAERANAGKKEHFWFEESANALDF